jgi:hypothetical protein
MQRDWPERLHLALVAILQVALAAELLAHLTAGAWVFALIVVVTAGLVILPLVARDQLGVPMAPGMQIAAVLFFYAACVPGEVWDFYGRIWWWDLAMHLVSGALLAMLAFVLLHRNGRTALPHGLVFLFAVIFALGCAALWELFEFAIDQAFSTTMQRPMLGDPSGLSDTMIDLALDGAGAIGAGAWGWVRLRRGAVPFIAAPPDAVRRPGSSVHG